MLVTNSWSCVTHLGHFYYLPSTYRLSFHFAKPCTIPWWLWPTPGQVWPSPWGNWWPVFHATGFDTGSGICWLRGASLHPTPTIKVEAVQTGLFDIERVWKEPSHVGSCAPHWVTLLRFRVWGRSQGWLHSFWLGALSKWQVAPLRTLSNQRAPNIQKVCCRDHGCPGLLQATLRKLLDSLMLREPGHDAFWGTSQLLVLLS